MQDSNAMLQLVMEGLANAGIDAQAVFLRLAEAGYMPSADGRINLAMQSAFWRIMEEITEDSEIGLHLCPHLPVYRGRVFEYLFLSSANYAEGLETAFKYQRLVGDAFSVQLVRDEAGPRILIEGANEDAPELRHSDTCSAYAFLQAMLRVTDGRFVPQRLRLRCRAIAPEHEYEEIFGCPVEFVDSPSEIWLDPLLLKCRSPHDDPEMLQLHKKYADNQIARLARKDLMDDVYEYLKSQLAHGRGGNVHVYRLADVARDFGVSARHLRFILAEAGTNYRELLKDARFAVARRQLLKTDELIENIATMLGFSEPSTFHRAFKEWSGMTPIQFRDASRENHA